MKFWGLHFLLGVCFLHWTTAFRVTSRKASAHIDNGTLKSVTLIGNASEIDLSNLGIEYIEENAFDAFTNLKKLNLSNNEIRNLPPLIFSKLKNLEELSLDNNRISAFHKTFVGLNNLKRLNIANNPFWILKKGYLFGLTKSTEIICGLFAAFSSKAFEEPSDSEITVAKEIATYPTFSEINPFPDYYQVKLCKTDDGIIESVEELKLNERLGNCMKTIIIREERKLYLRYLGVKKFQRGWYKLSDESVSQLDLSYNNITDITPELLNDLPSGLSSVNLTYNNIEIIKKGIIENRYCKILDLDHNSLSTIEDGALENTNLTIFSVGHNSLESLTFVRTLPKSIEKLQVHGNKISEIPGNMFSGFEKLQVINLADNRIEKIETETFKNLKNLRDLSLMWNNISELNSGLFKGLTMMKELNLAFNKIKNISRDTFSELRNLNISAIHLDANQIDNIEEGSFGNMNISWLSFFHNKITDGSIAKGAFNTCTLDFLDLGFNFMTKVNAELFNGISGPYTLYLNYNRIKNIKKGDVKFMGNVDRLDLMDNPLERLENGALYGLSKNKEVTIVLRSISDLSIQGGIFEDL